MEAHGRTTMKNMTKLVLAAAFGLLGVLTATEAGAVATSSATLNIEVTVVSNLSVKVNSVASSTDATASWNAGSANQFLAAVATATVTNDSGAQTEKWGLSTLARSIDQGTAGSWALQTNINAVGADEFAVQAVFGSGTTPKDTCPGAAADDWVNAFAPALTASPVTYTSTVFADTTLANGGGNTFKPDVFSGGNDGRMLAGSSRALCWRVRMPATTSTTDAQTIMVVISALNP
jgi:hypothetical protein